jgi:hypothetical protein
MKMRWTAITPNISLSEASLFRLVVRLFAYPSLFFASLSVATTDFSGQPIASPETLAILFSELKQPVILAGLSLPLLGLIASHLRSVQAKEQIEKQQVQIETQQFQNKFSNYLAHRDQFNTFFNEDQPMKGLSEISKWQIYGRLFPRATEADFGLDHFLVDFFKKTPAKICEVTQRIESTRFNDFENNEQILKSLKQIETDIQRFSDFDFRSCRVERSPLKSVEKSLIKQKALVEKLYQCSNFHRDELVIYDSWFFDSAYNESLYFVSDKAFQEVLYNLLSQLTDVPPVVDEKTKEKIESLRATVHYEGALREKTRNEDEFPALISEVLDESFSKDQQHSLLRFLPPEFQIKTQDFRTKAQDQEPSSNDSH